MSRYEPASQIAQRAAGTYRPDTGNGSDRARYAPLTERGRTGSAVEALAGVEAALLLECLCAAVAAGAGVTISATSDGGALSVTLLDARGRFRDYAADTTGVTSALLAVRDLCAPAEGQHPPTRTKRAR
jgi:hypothetical protein